MPILSFCDLDGTFIQTARHVKDQESDVVYTSDSGKDIVITKKQSQLYAELLRSGLVVPVTARSLESMNRALTTLTFPAHKICNHGVLIYDEADQVVKAYSDSLIAVVYRHQNNFKIALDKLSRLAIRNSVFEDTRFKPIYHSTHLMLIDGKAESDFHAKCIANYLNKLEGIIVSVNGSAFSITCEVPSYKQLACKYLVENFPQYQDCVTLGFGDSLSDLPFMQYCDFSVVPNTTRTQIKLGD